MTQIDFNHHRGKFHYFYKQPYAETYHKGSVTGHSNLCIYCNLCVCVCVCPAASLFCCFVQGILLCPQTLAQSRRARLRRAFTEATSETVSYVKTVGLSLYSSPHTLPASCLVATHLLFHFVQCPINLLTKPGSGREVYSCVHKKN
jgi:hypothetical protein